MFHRSGAKTEKALQLDPTSQNSLSCSLFSPIDFSKIIFTWDCFYQQNDNCWNSMLPYILNLLKKIQETSGSNFGCREFFSHKKNKRRYCLNNSCLILDAVRSWLNCKCINPTDFNKYTLINSASTTIY